MGHPFLRGARIKAGKGALALLLLLSTLLGCTQQTGGPAKTSGNTVSIRIENYAFNPATVTISKGATMVWTNQDQVGHSIEAPGFTSEPLGQGASLSTTWNTPGRYTYNCGIHSAMEGTVIVQ